jgi:hypothetical protein
MYVKVTSTYLGLDNKEIVNVHVYKVLNADIIIKYLGATMAEEITESEAIFYALQDKCWDIMHITELINNIPYSEYPALGYRDTEICT